MSPIAANRLFECTPKTSGPIQKRSGQRNSRDSGTEMIDPHKIPEEEKTPLVRELLHVVQALRENVQQLRDEIARLKQHKGNTEIPPGRLEENTKDELKM